MHRYRDSTAKVPRVKAALVGLIVLVVVTSAALGAGHRPHRAARAAGPFTLQATPGRTVLAPGATARFAIFVNRRRTRVGHSRRLFTAALRLSIAHLPPGAGASFSINPVRHSLSLLRVRTSPRTRPGTYRLVLRGRSGRRQTSTPLMMVVSRPSGGAAVITGSLTGLLSPGVSLPLDITLRNRGGVALRITQITVSLRAVVAPHADPAHPCSVGDFATTQFSGAYGFTLPAGGARSLADIGISPARWPWVSMLDRAANQDGCKAASLAFAYAASGLEGQP